MLINEVCKECALTKKAIEYYIEQGLVFPTMQENGYRCFLKEDVERLKKIAILRNLGLSTADIRMALSDQSAAALKDIADRQKIEIVVLQDKQKLIQELAENQNWEDVHCRLRQLEKKQSILERLMSVFPGYYGRYVCAHFAVYLNEPIETGEQQEAFDTIIDFLDNADFVIPKDLEKYLDEVLSDAAARCENGLDDFAEKISASIQNAVQDPEKFFADNREILETIMTYRQSDEYKASDAYRLKESFRQFGKMSGYNDIFIPAMCRLSGSYREYQEKLKEADDKLMQEYPQYADIL